MQFLAWHASWKAVSPRNQFQCIFNGKSKCMSECFDLSVLLEWCSGRWLIFHHRLVETSHHFVVTGYVWFQVFYVSFSFGKSAFESSNTYFISLMLILKLLKCVSSIQLIDWSLLIFICSTETTHFVKCTIILDDKAHLKMLQFLKKQMCGFKSRLVYIWMNSGCAYCPQGDFVWYTTLTALCQNILLQL